MKKEKNHTPAKKRAYSIAEKMFGIAAEDIFEVNEDIWASMALSIPLYEAGLPKLLTVPLDLIFFKNSDYKTFTIALKNLIPVNIDRAALEKITAVSAAYLTAPDFLQLAHKHEHNSNETPEIGIIYCYVSEVCCLINHRDTEECEVFREIQKDLIIIFAMLANHLGVSSTSLFEMGLHYSTLVIDE